MNERVLKLATDVFMFLLSMKISGNILHKWKTRVVVKPKNFLQAEQRRREGGGGRQRERERGGKYEEKFQF